MSVEKTESTLRPPELLRLEQVLGPREAQIAREWRAAVAQTAYVGLGALELQQHLVERVAGGGGAALHRHETVSRPAGSR